MISSGVIKFLASPLALLTLTVVVYWVAMKIYKRFKYAILHPMLIAMAIIIGYLKVMNVEYETYYEANSIINFMLGLSVVALGYLLYEKMSQIRGNEVSILMATIAGSVVGVVGVLLLALAFGLSWEISVSLQPKSATMPIALVLSEMSNGVTALTAIAVLITGLLGSIIGPWFLRLIGVNDPVARGLAMGSASHAFGVARAMEMGAVEGAAGGLAMGIMGVLTALIIPIIEFFIIG